MLVLAKSKAPKHISMNLSDFNISFHYNVCLICICECVTAEFRTIDWYITQHPSAFCSLEALGRIQYLNPVILGILIQSGAVYPGEDTVSS